MPSPHPEEEPVPVLDGSRLFALAVAGAPCFEEQSLREEGSHSTWFCLLALHLTPCIIGNFHLKIFLSKV